MTKADILKAVIQVSLNKFNFEKRSFIAGIQFVVQGLEKYKEIVLLMNHEDREKYLDNMIADLNEAIKYFKEK